MLYDLGEQALGSEEILTTADLFKYVDSINTSDVTAVSMCAAVQEDCLQMCYSVKGHLFVVM